MQTNISPALQICWFFLAVGEVKGAVADGNDSLATGFEVAQPIKNKVINASNIPVLLNQSMLLLYHWIIKKTKYSTLPPFAFKNSSGYKEEDYYT